MNSWNETLFLMINAGDVATAATISAATGIAQFAVFIIPLLLAALWVWGRGADRGGLLLAFCASQVALALNQIITLLYYHPRPFAVPVGRTLVDHAADSSFPSDHVTFLSAIGMGLYLWTDHRLVGFCTLALALVVGWCRVYLGVHFPADILGAVVPAAAGVLALAPGRRWIVERLMPRFVDPLYSRLFSLPIRRGWLRP